MTPTPAPDRAGVSVSVVVVSHGRPQALCRCLTGLARQIHGPYEIVVVADGPGRAALARLPFADRLHVVGFDEANISRARNLGITAAAGDIVAFIDDDAVPEPAWLHHLAAAFSDPQVAAAGGYVRGRNGISFQSRARSVDHCGRTAPIRLRGPHPVALTPTRERAIKLEGTNMAFRRAVIAGLGGFDPRYRFFLDETDVNLRMGRRGLVSAIVPLAQVHHGFAASRFRRADRVPRDLHEIGASWAVFLNAHAPHRVDAAWRRVQAEERARCIRHLIAGGIEPGAMRRLLASLEAGFAEGLTRRTSPLAPLPPPVRDFLRFTPLSVPDDRFLAGPSWRLGALRAEARALAESGINVTLLSLSPSALFHRVEWRDTHWEQRGGLFGKSKRSQPLLAFWRPSRRIEAERQRVAAARSAAELCLESAGPD
ncbi:glycosyltransferase family 2 protein [Pontibaca methylaminivorans]|uniref:glycosyltransferase family 2 protein n=1 Tax=Pontibaca methylaminivorans TaxID=515897 RepID=UPI002FD93999